MIKKVNSTDKPEMDNQQKLRAIFSYTPNPFKPSRGYSLDKVVKARNAVRQIPLEDVIKFIIDNPYRATAFFDKTSYTPFRKKLCHRPDLLIRLFAARDKKINEAIDNTGLLYSRHFKVAVMEAQRLIDRQGQNHSYLNTLQKAVLEHRYDIAQETKRECIKDPIKNAARIANADAFIDFYDKKMAAMKRSEKYNPQDTSEITAGLEEELKEAELDKSAEKLISDIYGDSESEDSRGSLMRNTNKFSSIHPSDSMVRNSNINNSSGIRGNSESFKSSTIKGNSDSWSSFGEESLKDLDKLIKEHLKKEADKFLSDPYGEKNSGSWAESQKELNKLLKEHLKNESKAPNKPLPKPPVDRRAQATKLGRNLALGLTIDGKKPLPKEPKEVWVRHHNKPLPERPDGQMATPKKPLPETPKKERKDPFEGMPSNPLAKRFGRK